MCVYSKLILFIRTIYWGFVNSRLEHAGVGGTWRVYRDYAYPIGLLNILIVEDHYTILHTLRAISKLQGYSVGYSDTKFVLLF